MSDLLNYNHGWLKDKNGKPLAPITTSNYILTNTGEMLEQRIVGNEDKISKKANKNNPVFTGSISVGRKPNTTVGNGSVAIGNDVEASGDYSYAEGDNTNASSSNQHVQGRYNIEDTENKYAHIVGNGESEDYRSNAHTVDWKGNAWYAGKLTQEGAPTEEKDLATKKYVDDQKPFVAEYNVTTFAEIQNEYNSKKVVLCTNEGLVTKLDILAPDNYAQFSGLDDKGNPALLKVTKDNEWTRKNVMHTTPNYVDSLFNTANTNITSLKTSVDDIGRYINGKDPMLSALDNMNAVDILKSVYSFRGGFQDNAGTLHIKKPGIYLVLQGGKENKQIIINQNGTEVLNETWNGIIILAYDNAVITPIGIATSLAIAGTIKMPGTYQGWTNDGSYSTTINYPAQCVISYLGNGNVNYLE